MAPIKRGDRFPTTDDVYYIPPEGGEPGAFELSKFVKTKKFVVVSVPGAFTPPCTEQHLPGYIKNLPRILSKGVDFVLVITQNDPFVLKGWKKELGAADAKKLIFVSDPNLKLTKKLGSTIDLSSIGLGTRSGRLALIVNRSGIVEYAAIENGGEVDVSTAQKIIAKL
ncbi:hypothetical protein B5S28_g3222 [[Candida] boidinii]|uniref:Putative peroxiredoxin-B n=2 Tax=Candida boidinii TaxID=5477 RepID=PMPB_CANBO|nr:RecName: Full=Putative peroxiredoxin-B; AltName: Full=PMP20; AltName: Full=Peroxisomal membrane protein B; AltName: Full=Thioredoxin reductase; AltName: Full=Thioredoxin-dependent peroxiredoxin-B; AltName: Allergen=Cand b 2 [[Candida] boidinii]AAA34358.1 peroxisomal membrane protein (PMP20B) [[Candida] boidinii]OWB57286.1 hypothetical protein B5S28_g3222 [[Candida] boidinii]OWB74184.1 hypothetical protein B5S31_g3967 [[Candida] boidinii]GME68789.1 unnamed protein product [[Candida] boidinii]